MSTGFADPVERYIHIICQAEDKGLCGEHQHDPIWLEEDCSVCAFIKEVQYGACPYSGVICACLSA